jgi:nucleotide-binding universal stress UspA family protein
LTNNVKGMYDAKAMDVKKILVPLRNISVADEEAVRLACSLAKEKQVEVHLIYIIEVERSRTLDEVPLLPEREKSEAVLDNGEEIASAMGCKVIKNCWQAREFGPAVIDEAKDGFDLIVMGIEYEKRRGIFDPGKTIQNLFRESPCAVLLYRSPVMGEV